MSPEELLRAAETFLRSELDSQVAAMLLNHSVQRRYEVLNGRLADAPAAEQREALAEAVRHVCGDAEGYRVTGEAGSLKDRKMVPSSLRTDRLLSAIAADERLLPAFHVLIGARHAMVGLRIANRAMALWERRQREREALPAPGLPAPALPGPG